MSDPPEQSPKISIKDSKVGRVTQVEGNYTETHYHAVTQDWDKLKPDDVDLKAELHTLSQAIAELTEIRKSELLSVQAKLAEAEELSDDPKSNKQTIGDRLTESAAILEDAEGVAEKGLSLAKTLVKVGGWVLSVL